MKIEASISLRRRDEEVKVQGKPHNRIKYYRATELFEFLRIYLP